eukprot:GHVO01031261.1.p1 GENE.GHVO01031261.1~~GHVO01031261.1.p1  ORF type:complete len:813 (+),score=67.53 GHVO01031261.1:114-2552(+)
MIIRCSVVCLLLAVATATQDGILRFHPLVTNKLRPLSDASNVMCPDKQGSCPKDSTCCKMSSGKYGCCPLEDAVCCKDNLHCCPAKTQCDLVHQLCTPSADSAFDAPIPMFVKVPAVPNAPGNIMCPDKKDTCPKGNTCCLLASGEYGCCPLSEAVCCDDGEHCCPHGYSCDSSAGTCQKKAIESITPKAITEPTKVICPDQRSMCEDGQTCCQLADAQYACCPLPKAVCCNDHLHCCPEGSTCSGGKCLRGNVLTKGFAKQPSIQVAQPVSQEQEKECPDKVSTCPEGTTCCEMLNGHYGCCPKKNAVCCSDKLHCCAEGQTCNTTTWECDDHRQEKRLPWQQKMPATMKVESVTCPDGVSECPDGSTCCLLGSGQYGCCPLPHAVCCSDHVHCCPNGYTCGSGTCSMDDISVPWQRKTPALAAKQPEEVTCPGGTATCPDKTTCCLLKSGGYGCCPYPEATCCSDGEHCCPNGYTCDPASATCHMTSEQTKILVAEPENVKCDETHECPSGTTCCKLPSGQFGCCPYVKATCCSDGLHCCPQGMTCDLTTQTCQSMTNSLAFTWTSVKRPSAFVSVKPHAEVVNCPDHTQCPSGTTCCALGSGKYGCCPYPKAVCCDDHIHCCPSGYKCDVSGGTCVKEGSSLSLEWTMHTRDLAADGDVQCPDTTVKCPDGSTCCKLVTGQYGCCPLPNAVCCKDGQHCCPEKTTCDESSGRCKSKSLDIPWAEKTPAKPAEAALADDVCPDKRYRCPQGKTCCKLAGGSWGCCPYPQAICCSDGIHCCPRGYICDAKKGSCLKSEDGSTAFLSALTQL